MVRTRFAPSPTGYLHVGGLRTALYCYLFARTNGGKFLLRIEDTDQERYVEGAVENLIRTLDWVGLKNDEGPYLDEKGEVQQKGDFGPYIQSQRFDLYKKYADELVEKGQAYYCFCTRERLDELRKKQESLKQATMYDRHCCTIPLAEARKRAEAGEPHVIRQKIPNETLKFKDLIRGNVQFDGKTIDDQVLIKSDGFPTYHLANVVDDHLMEITHVIRGEEWLPSTPKHIFLYQAFGWKAPEFAHIPLLLNEDRTKLSKRQGDVAVEDYIKKGYLKETIINFAAFLGWHPGSGEETEIFTLQELEQKFSLDRVHKAGAIFNIEKLDWYNWQWQKRLFNEKMQKVAKEIDAKVEIAQPKPGVFTYTFTSTENNEKFREKKAEDLLEICDKYINENLLKKCETHICKYLLEKAVILNEEKVLKEPKNINDNISFFFELPPYDKTFLTNAKMNVDETLAKSSIQKAIEVLETVEEENWTEGNLKEKLLALIQSLNLKNGQVLWPLRVALTGKEFSPGVFEMLWALGKAESLSRLKKIPL